MSTTNTTAVETRNSTDMKTGAQLPASTEESALPVPMDDAETDLPATTSKTALPATTQEAALPVPVEDEEAELVPAPTTTS